jgi:formyltetrahydrofolate deformylase
MTTPAAAAFVLTLSCPDRAGIVHAVTGVLVERGANITEAQQFNDAATGLFFMRVQFDAPGATLEALNAAFSPLVERLGLRATLAPAAERMRTLILVSQLGHCLNDLLFRWRTGLLALDIRGVVSNHGDFESLVRGYGLPFHHLPVSAATKPAAEARLVELMDAEGIELVVLARYMQILSDALCRRLAGRAINIHHSFLPSFKGAQPYRQAFDRGVKIIGATAHYVTADLDEGPIIEQDIARVDHSHDPAELTAIGRDVECAVLARAVRWHAERRVLIDRNKTVVFR